MTAHDRDTRLDTLARGVDCPRCGAWADTPCTTMRRAGRPTTPHAARIDKAVRIYLRQHPNAAQGL